MRSNKLIKTLQVDNRTSESKESVKSALPDICFCIEGSGQVVIRDSKLSLFEGR